MAPVNHLKAPHGCVQTRLKTIKTVLPKSAGVDVKLSKQDKKEVARSRGRPYWKFAHAPHSTKRDLYAQSPHCSNVVVGLAEFVEGCIIGTFAELCSRRYAMT